MQLIDRNHDDGDHDRNLTRGAEVDDFNAVSECLRQ